VTAVVSFGYLHREPPVATYVVDVRHRFRDPHIDPAMRELTGRCTAVRDNVLAQPGALEFIQEVVLQVSRDRAGAVSVAIGCAGGRHRSVVLASEVARLLGTTAVHLDIDKPVVEHTPEENRDG
jgi:RNase adaptor protein for sRNA GlmZ degradation